ncbi:MAG: hypothetical protein ABIP63_06710 [Thermoanaerobaculia bacterium]
MLRDEGDLLASRRGVAAVSVALTLLFLAPRIALLVTREFFFDELFTHWLAAHPPATMVGLLRADSGPPLYYAIIHLLGNPALFATRLVSLACALGSFAAILSCRRLGPARFLAAALLAAYPPAALFATDARAYALCALLVTLAMIALVCEKPWLAAAAIVAAACSHYYGLLFLPSLLLRGRKGARALAASLAAIIPLLWLARHQPVQATGWMGEWKPSFADILFAPFDSPPSLFKPAPLWLAALAAFVAALTLIRCDRKIALFAAWTVGAPYACALLAGLAGRRIYFPMRFESVIAPPLVLLLAACLDRWPRVWKMTLTSITIAIGLVSIDLAAVDHASRPPDDYRQAAQFVGRHVPPATPVVATGYLYLETVALRPAIAYPASQALHPGWRTDPHDAEGSPLPDGAFIWIGERQAPELATIQRSRIVKPLFVNGRALVAAVR